MIDLGEDGMCVREAEERMDMNKNSLNNHTSFLATDPGSPGYKLRVDMNTAAAVDT